MRRLLVLTAVALALPAAAAEAVVGGRPASEPYPHMTALFADGAFTCGGSLLAPDRVLTAAHCVTDGDGRPRPASRFLLDPGATDVSDGPSSAARRAAEVVVHPSYDPRRSERFDVAVLRLVAPAGRGAPIALADPQADRAAWEPGDEVRVIGFGAEVPSDPGLTGGGPLREVDVPVVADGSCASSYGDAFDPATMVCAGRTLGMQDSCQGDSGGPLMAPAAGGGRVVVGVVSFGFACGFPQRPGVYARVGEGVLARWVREQLPAAAPSGPPGPSATPSPAARRAAVRLRTRRLLLRRDGRVAVRVACAAGRACRGSVTLTKGRRRAGRTAYRVAAGRTATVRVRVTPRLRRARALRVRVTVAGGRPVTRVLRVRR